MKGFLFSIEALFAMIIIISAITIVQYGTIQTPTNEPAVLFQNQNAQLTTLYFNLPGTNPTTTSTTQYCTTIEKYSPATKSFIDTNVCKRDIQ